MLEGGAEGRNGGKDGWMEGLPLLRFSGGPCFLPVQTEERVRNADNMAQRKEENHNK